MKSLYISFFISILLLSCKVYKPVDTFEDRQYNLVDYSNLDHWAAHPDKIDESDRTPEGDTVRNTLLLADVFFIHPTTYIGEKKQDKWNAGIDDKKVNQKTDEGTIRFQASVFNQAGRIFAPRYRQAHIHAYFSKDLASSKKAFDLAYKDVKNAFEYYLQKHNNGRPFIIASHSQGTNHAERLIEEFISGAPLKEKLIAAYLLGMPVKKDRFKDIKPCSDSTETGCFVSWRTFKSGHHLVENKKDGSIAVTNPLSWTSDTQYVPKSYNRGTLLYDFDKLYPDLVDAQVHNNILWANKPKFRGSVFLRTKNYHIADVNFYYNNIRQNAKLRVMKFLHLQTE
ncbi:MAG: DUF3089 domain-containing protein [Saprospiraceae bacterium]|nr:DUF3089 domain-containing protein [Saprospiraceae bacterium]